MKIRTLNFLSYESRTSNPAAFLFFAAFIALQLALLLACIRYFFRSTWDLHLSSGFGAIVATCLVCNLVFCFGEYLFHRYLLHIETVRFLRTLCTSHLTHHKLTFIGFDDEEKRVRSAYSIGDVEHDDQSTFPPWALLPFFAFFTPFFAPMAFSFPHLPILISGYIAIAVAHFLYETIHAVNHMPYDTWWKQRIEGPLFGRVWRHIYGFHQAHHANYKCNINVAGFFGIPLGDLVFGTYKQPDPLFIDGAPATKEAARSLIPRPRWPISWLDGVVFRRRRWMSKKN
jgi:hemolysin III